MQSLPMSLVGGIAVGVAERIVLANVDQRTSRSSTSTCSSPCSCSCCSSIRNRRDDAGWSLSAQVKPMPERLRSPLVVRLLPPIGFARALRVPRRCSPFFLTQPSQEFLWTEILIFALVALSLTVLTGWAGQLSLGQFAFVGLGALTMVALRTGIDIPVPFDLWDMQFAAGLAARRAHRDAPSASSPRSSIGLPALRVRGLFLAVTTLAFAVMCPNWLFRQRRGPFASSARRRRASTRRCSAAWTSRPPQRLLPVPGRPRRR